MIFAITIPADLLSCAHRPRASVSRRGKLRMHKADSYAAWLAYLRAVVTRPDGWPLDAAYEVQIALRPPDRIARDGDNVCKPLLDALQWPRLRHGRYAPEPHTSTLWRDDSQVRSLSVVVGAHDPDRPRLSLIARVLAPGDAEAHAVDVEHGTRIITEGT